MRILIFSLFAALSAFSASARVDNYRIPADALMTTTQSEIATLMALNAHGDHNAVRTLYRSLKAIHHIIELGAVEVSVVDYYPDGTAKIGWIVTPPGQEVGEEVFCFISQKDLLSIN